MAAGVDAAQVVVSPAVVGRAPAAALPGAGPQPGILRLGHEIVPGGQAQPLRPAGGIRPEQALYGGPGRFLPFGLRHGWCHLTVRPATAR